MLTLVLSPLMVVFALSILRQGIQGAEDVVFGLVAPACLGYAYYLAARWRARYGSQQEWFEYYHGGGEDRQRRDRMLADRISTEWPRLRALLVDAKDLPADVRADLVDGPAQDVRRAAEATLALADLSDQGEEAAARYQRSRTDLEETIEEFSGLLDAARAYAAARAAGDLAASRDRHGDGRDDALREVTDARMGAEALLHTERLSVAEGMGPNEIDDVASQQVAATG
ncbi:hypothetical protein DVS28_a2929 [Euzebya pacifica]|uniref:Uncharacterized protein n=1 Tax=Euzebya pacifica TaxID=1608957 RepID=A0A346XZG1_9ACTN|nr:hypothetical protein [Euzebya pacifica]AXV07608.1 hypothetical protein DVS28_a2929 [Euzebya pacifica]